MSSSSSSDSGDEMTDSDLSGSAFTQLLMGGPSIEKATKMEMAHMYAQEMKSMVKCYESFINEMQELSLGPTPEITKRRIAQPRPNVGAAKVVRDPSGNASGDRQEILSSTDGSLSGSHEESISPPSMNGDASFSVSEQATPLVASSPAAVPPNIIVKSCCSSDKLHKKLDVMVCFLQKLFGNQVQLLGKCYQDQMEMRQRVDDLKALTEDYDDELEHLETQSLVLKKAIDDMKSFTSKSVDKKMKIILEEIQQSVTEINQTTGNLYGRVSRLLTVIENKEKIDDSISPDSLSGILADVGMSAPKSSAVSDDLGLD